MAPSRRRTSTTKEWPANHVELRPIASLIRYARNARMHSAAQVAQLKASMVEFGWTIPVLVDEDDVLIAGHGRLLAAEQLQWLEAPVMVARGWTKAQVQAYRIADNKLALNADWDNELLKIEMAELKDVGFDMNLLGFDEPEINALLDGIDADNAPDAV